MDITTINTTIQSGTLLLITLLVFLTYRINVKKKDIINNEKDLLKDCLFYREVINKYRKETDRDSSKYNTYRNDINEMLRFSNSEKSQPAQIKKRLSELKLLNEKIEKVIEKSSQSLSR